MNFISSAFKMQKTYLIKTLSEFILDKQADFQFAQGDLSSLLYDVSLAAKIVNWDVNRAGLGDILGEAGNTNVQGEDQKKLDVFADEIFIEAFKAGGQICALASEENDTFLPLTDERSKDAKYVISFDPLDGSSNIDVNVSIGTIFSIYRRISTGDGGNHEDFMQKGVEQVAAGYVLYGSSTMLVYTTGNGVNGFTLDPSIGEFCLSHPDIKIPDTGKVYSINEGNYVHFKDGVKQYLKYCQAEDAATNRPYSGRYIGSLVADFHRNLLKGGIYIYPATASSPTGKLRLLYECNPLAMIAEQAGGKATTGYERILDIEPNDVHQRVPFFCGNTEMVEKAEEFMREFSPQD